MRATKWLKTVMITRLLLRKQLQNLKLTLNYYENGSSQLPIALRCEDLMGQNIGTNNSFKPQCEGFTFMYTLTYTYMYTLTYPCVHIRTDHA